MANQFFYYDFNGEKHGPYSGGQIKELAKKGTIMPGTTIELENGKTALAKKVQGLSFPEKPVTIPAETTSSAGMSQWTDDEREFFEVAKNKVNAVIQDGLTPLHIALIKFANLEMVKQLIARGANVNAKENSARTPLHFAASEKKDVAFVKCLVAAGANVHAKDKHGLTAFIYAKEFGHTEVAEYLANASTTTSTGLSQWTDEEREFFETIKNDVNQVGQGGVTPLHVALIKYTNLEMVKQLIAMGANVNAKENNACTSLHFIAGKNSDIAFAKCLVAAGADVHAKDKWGMTALDHAKGNGHTEIAEYLASVSTTPPPVVQTPPVNTSNASTGNTNTSATSESLEWLRFDFEQLKMFLSDSRTANKIEANIRDFVRKNPKYSELEERLNEVRGDDNADFIRRVAHIRKQIDYMRSTGQHLADVEQFATEFENYLRRQ